MPSGYATEKAREFDLGNDAYGRPVTIKRQRSYDGKVFWELVISATSQRDDDQKLYGLTDANIEAMVDALAQVKKGPR